MKRIAIAFCLLLAGLFMSAPAANAQSIGVHIGGRHGGVSVEFGYPGYGYGYGRGPGCYDCGPIYRRPPIYHGPGCYDCGYDRDYDRGYHQPIVVTVYMRELMRDRVYDDYCGCYRMVEDWVSVRRQVTAYWDDYRGGYWYVDNYGRRMPIN